MDVVLRDDECRIRCDNAPANFATIKHMAGNLMLAMADKHSMRRLAAWDDANLATLITGTA
jgi:predicted transposase YbfD/YdcC